MAATFRNTGLGAARAFLLHGKEFLLLMLLGALILTGAHVAAAWQNERSYNDLTNQDAMAIDMEMLDILRNEQQSGNTDPDVAEELRIVRMRIAARMQALAGYSTDRTWLRTIMRIMDATLMIALLIAAFTWVLTRRTHPLLNAKTVLRMTMQNYARIVAILFLMFFFSLLWIPGLAVVFIRLYREAPQGAFATIQTLSIFFGYFVTVILLPRLALAPMLAMREPMGALSCLLSSYERSRGQWGKILSMLLGVLVMILIVSLIVSMMIAHVAGHNSIAMVITHRFLLIASILTIGLFLSTIGDDIFAKQADHENASPKPKE